MSWVRFRDGQAHGFGLLGPGCTSLEGDSEVAYWPWIHMLGPEHKFFFFDLKFIY